MRKLLLAGGAVLAAMAVLALPAAASTIDLGIGDPGSVITIASGGGTASVSGAVIGNVTLDLSGIGAPPLSGGDLLDGNTIAVRSAGAPASASFWVSSTDNTSPTGKNLIESSFTQNLLTVGWKVEAFTYADNTNAAFGTQQLLSTTVFSTSHPPTVDLLALADLGAGPFSLSERWLVTAPGPGQTNNTTDMAVKGVPLDAMGTGLPGLIAGLMGLIGLQWHRRRWRA